MKKIKIFSLALILTLTTACSDFLTEYPNGSIPQDKAITNLNDLDAAVIGVYSAYKSSALYSGLMTHLPDIQADMGYLTLSNTGTYADIYRWDIKPTTSQVTGVYSSLYSVIARCNFVMKYKDAVEQTLTTELEKKTFEKRIADVYFARALAYAELIRFYCEAYTEENADKENSGVSIHLTYSNTSTGVKRSTLRESYAQVLSDLDMSEKLMPLDRSVADSQWFSPGVINALKARVYLYIGEYQKSIDAATKIIKSDVYSLADAFRATSTGYTDYSNMWIYDSSDEIIWKIFMSNNDRGGALGKVFLNYNGATYSPDYIVPKNIEDLYADADMRYPNFFTQVNAADGTKPVIVRKYLGNPNIDAGATKLFTNMPKVFRLSEVYLIRAEAYWNLGNYTASSNDISSIRRKRIKDYGSFGSAGDALLKEIQEERARELYMEGFRLSDMKRWKKDIVRKKQIYTVDGPKANQLVVKYGDSQYRFTTWPIPQHEIEASNNVVVGNASNY